MVNAYLDLIHYVQVDVRFLKKGCTYTYLHSDYNTFKKGDHAIVLTDDGYKVVEVADVREDLISESDDIPYKWIVSKLDTTGYESKMKCIESGKKKMEQARRQVRCAETLDNYGTTMEEARSWFEDQQ